MAVEHLLYLASACIRSDADAIQRAGANTLVPWRIWARAA